MNPHYKIAHMQPRDLEAVALLEHICFTDPWSYDSFMSELNNTAAQYLVLYVDDELMGYGGMWMIFDEAHVTNVAVHPHARKRGYGMLMMRALMRLAVSMGATRMTLEVRAGNEAARHMYEKLQFYSNGLRKGYYADNGEDAIIMWNDDIAATEAYLADGGVK